eukprot:15074-Heterococcus_DN1.PRE.1
MRLAMSEMRELGEGCRPAARTGAVPLTAAVTAVKQWEVTPDGRVTANTRDQYCCHYTGVYSSSESANAAVAQCVVPIVQLACISCSAFHHTDRNTHMLIHALISTQTFFSYHRPGDHISCSSSTSSAAVLQCCSEYAQSTAGDRWSTTSYDDRAVHTRRTTATCLSSLTMYTACSIGAAAWCSDVSAAAAIELACTAACYHHSSMSSCGERHSQVASTSIDEALL